MSNGQLDQITDRQDMRGGNFIYAALLREWDTDIPIGEDGKPQCEILGFDTEQSWIEAQRDPREGGMGKTLTRIGIGRVKRWFGCNFCMYPQFEREVGFFYICTDNKYLE